MVKENPRRCCVLITKLLFLLVKGEVFSSTETTEVFFGVTKLFVSEDVNLRRMMYLFIKEVAEICNPDDVIIVIGSLTKDMNTGEDLYRANSMRVLAKIIDSTMLSALERYLKQAIVDKNAFVASSALMSGLRLFVPCPDVVRRWVNEVQEAVNSSSNMVQYHALSLLYKIKQHDRLAVSKIVQQLSRGSLRSPLATCLLIRYTSSLLSEDTNTANTKAAYQFLENCLRHKNEMVIYEAAKAICNLPSVDSSDLHPAITVLQLFLSSPKPSLRFAAMRTLSDIAVNQPMSVAKCNEDMESLVSDNNRSIATLAITTLLKTGNEGSVDRLMKQISTFMVEIGDEFKVVVVKAIRELCMKYPAKHRIMVSFLATFLREEGGYDFKKSIVDCIIDLMTEIPDTKESSLLHLCEFIEDCEFSELIVQVLHLIGTLGPSTLSPSKYIRFIFNRVILETAIVRAAAVSTLGVFAVRVRELRPAIIILLRRSLTDEDDEVRDRTAVLISALEKTENEQELKFLVDEPLPMSFSQLERSTRALCTHHGEIDEDITFQSLPVVEEVSTPGVVSSQKIIGSKKIFDRITEKTLVDPVDAIHKIPEFAEYGRVFRSSSEIPLTENEMEYVVSCTKHIFEKHVVLQFSIVNTIDDQKLQNIFVNIEVDGDAYVVEKTIPASFASYGETSTSYVSLSKVGDPVPCTMSCELRFKVIQVDPTNGDVEGDEDGYEEEYPLETMEISTSDFMAKTSTGDFRRCWEGAGNEGEVLEKFALQYKKLLEASNAVIEFLGMQAVDDTEVVSVTDERKNTHTIHLSGAFIGNVPVLVRAQLQNDEVAGIVLKLAVRSSDKKISQLVAECIR